VWSQTLLFKQTGGDCCRAETGTGEGMEMEMEMGERGVEGQGRRVRGMAFLQKTMGMGKGTTRTGIPLDQATQQMLLATRCV